MTRVDLSQPFDLSADGSTLWALSGEDVATIDTATGAVNPLNLGYGGAKDGIFATPSAVWVAAFDGSRLLKIDPATDQLVDRILAPSAEDVLQVGGEVWVSNHHQGTMTVVDATTDAVLDTVTVGINESSGPSRLAFGAGSVWVGQPNTDQVIRLDPTTHEVIAKISMPGIVPCGDIVASDTQVWITGCHEQQEIARIDPSTNSEVTVVPLDGYPQMPVSLGTRIWVAVAGELERIDPGSNMVDLVLPFPELQDVAGSTIVGQDLWVADGINTIFRVPLAQLPSP